MRRFRPMHAAAALSAAFALAGCGDSEQSDGETSAGAGSLATDSRTITGLCSTPCTDGQQDFVDQLAIVPRPRRSNLLDADDVIVSMRVRLKNIGYVPAVIKAGGGKHSEFKLIDSQLHTLSPSETFDKRNEPVAQCPPLGTITLQLGDSHTFHLCFVLPNRKALPRVLRLRNLAEIGLR
jgi:hypothetical protein